MNQGFRIKFLVIFLISAPLWASPLTEIDESLSKLFDKEVVAEVKNDEDTLDYNEICHKKLDKFLSKIDKDKQVACTQAISPGLSIEKLTATLNQDRLARALAREQVPLYADFLKSCHDKLSDFHMKVQEFTIAAYDISFQDRKKPKAITVPDGYEAAKFYGNDPLSCYNTGFKAALFKPKGDSDHVIFAITGTEADSVYSDGSKRETHTVRREVGFISKSIKDVELSAEDMDKEDWSTKNDGATGRRQAATRCAQKLVDDAVEIAKKQGKKIIITGHSLGGALSQGLSYRVNKKLKDKKIDGEVQSVNFMPAPGYHTVHPDLRDDAVASDTSIINYVSKGDIVSTENDNFIARSGPHIGEIRIMERKKELEDAYVQGGKSINTHSMNKDCYGHLGCSERAEGQDLKGMYFRYHADLRKQKEELNELKKQLEEDTKKIDPRDDNKDRSIAS